ncbi:hypothetical protein ACJIZ3_018765 [Penstemon smallii]|uniref:phospholipase A2 n=1 Tax=Penstemon smallii TaxID=265156 RepID=A0ABD3T0H6_9LAMI
MVALNKTCVAAAALLIFIFFHVEISYSSHQAGCGKTCVAVNCNTIGIRYGKFCGVGYTGCLGEKPCDHVDACCKIHDECVGKHGVTSINCHESFKRCLGHVQKSGKVGFSTNCTYDIAVPTMIRGMDMAILVSGFGRSK